MSFIVGMISMSCAVLVLLSTSQTWAMWIFTCFMAASMLAFLVFVMTSYKFGTSLTTHAATLALEHLHGDLEAAQGGVFAVHGATQSVARQATTHLGASEDAPEDKAEEPPSWRAVGAT